MHPVIYDVAVSLDGFISGPAGDISKFAHEGPVVEDYYNRLGGYKLALMGRKTYEFGYEFGMEPGQNPYPHMRSIVVSDSLQLPETSEVTVLKRPSAEGLRAEIARAEGSVYLCGGGAFAGWMLKHQLIDRLILKRAPCVLGQGVPLFGADAPAVTVERTATTPYQNGYLLERFLLR
ncbi:MAG: dihydrofolate reductase family protein [Epibacterium sp.]